MFKSCNQAQRIAYTNEVKRNGSVTQNHSGRIIRKPMHTAREIKNASQYFEVEFVSTLMLLLYAAKIRQSFKIIFLS